MKIVTIGTGEIVEEFIKTSRSVQDVEVIGSYSRNLQRAQDFSIKMNLNKYYDNFENIALDNDIGTVYIASPNSLHYSQAKYFLNNKHVIIEKPLMASADHAKEILKLAKENNLLVFEAISNIHTPNFKTIKKYVSEIGDVKMVSINYSQYSSKYDAFKNGENPNVFTQQFAGGTLMDTNIYNIHLVHSLFGMPQAMNYFPNIERNIDTSGILILNYGSFKAVCIAAKDCDGPSHITIQGEKGVIHSKGPSNELKNLQITLEDDVLHIDDNVNHRLSSEIEHFSILFKEHDFNTAYTQFERSIEVVEILEYCWKQVGFKFEDQ